LQIPNWSYPTAAGNFIDRRSEIMLSAANLTLQEELTFDAR
jgi:hypothetical protein